MSTRIFPLPSSKLRDCLLRAHRGEVDQEIYEQALEVLIDVVDACNTAESFHDEIADDARDVPEIVRTAITKAKEAETRADETEATVKEAAKKEREEREERNKERCEELATTCDELRRRAEKGEHALASAVRDGHALDQEARQAVQEARGGLSGTEAGPPWLPELLAALGHSGGHWNGAIAEVRALREKHTEVSKVARAWLEGAIGWMEAADQLAKLLFGAEEYERRTTERITGLGKAPMKRRTKA